MPSLRSLIVMIAAALDVPGATKVPAAPMTSIATAPRRKDACFITVPLSASGLAPERSTAGAKQSRRGRYHAAPSMIRSLTASADLIVSTNRMIERQRRIIRMDDVKKLLCIQTDLQILSFYRHRAQESFAVPRRLRQTNSQWRGDRRRCPKPGISVVNPVRWGSFRSIVGSDSGSRRRGHERRDSGQFSN
jgi:hypothetical protein